MRKAACEHVAPGSVATAARACPTRRSRPRPYAARRRRTPPARMQGRALARRCGPRASGRLGIAAAQGRRPDVASTVPALRSERPPIADAPTPAVSLDACLLAGVRSPSCALACSRTPPPPRRQFSQKLVVLGFDGMDPDLVRAVDRRGQAAEPRQAGRRTAASTTSTPRHSPESPTAWASFATGVEPGQAQHLRLPRARHADLHARPRHREARARRVPASTTSRSSGRSPLASAAAPRSGSRRARRASGRACSRSR